MVLFALFYGGKMLVLAKNKKIEDLEKYGFEILIKDEEINEKNFYNDLATKKESNSYEYVIENDEYYRGLTIRPTGNIPFKICLTFQLDLLYKLIKDKVIVRR